MIPETIEEPVVSCKCGLCGKPFKSLQHTDINGIKYHPKCALRVQRGTHKPETCVHCGKLIYHTATPLVFEGGFYHKACRDEVKHTRQQKCVVCGKSICRLDKAVPHGDGMAHRICHSPKDAARFNAIKRQKICECGRPAVHITPTGKVCDRCRKIEQSFYNSRETCDVRKIPNGNRGRIHEVEDVLPSTDFYSVHLP